jgi:hypothetical protein
MKPRSKPVQSTPPSGSKRSSAPYDEEAKARPDKRQSEEEIGEAMETQQAAVRRGVETEQRSSSPSRERIAERAHTIWEREGRPEGREDEFWFRAESELKDERS